VIGEERGLQVDEICHDPKCLGDAVLGHPSAAARDRPPSRPSTRPVRRVRRVCPRRPRPGPPQRRAENRGHPAAERKTRAVLAHDLQQRIYRPGETGLARCAWISSPSTQPAAALLRYTRASATTWVEGVPLLVRTQPQGIGHPSCQHGHPRLVLIRPTLPRSPASDSTAPRSVNGLRMTPPEPCRSLRTTIMYGHHRGGSGFDCRP
jgi:hypothetical protein